jgi:hypothetical protein
LVPVNELSGDGIENGDADMTVQENAVIFQMDNTGFGDRLRGFADRLPGGAGGDHHCRSHQELPKY